MVRHNRLSVGIFYIRGDHNNVCGNASSLFHNKNNKGGKMNKLMVQCKDCGNFFLHYKRLTGRTKEYCERCLNKRAYIAKKAKS